MNKDYGENKRLTYIFVLFLAAFLYLIPALYIGTNLINKTGKGSIYGTAAGIIIIITAIAVLNTRWNVIEKLYANKDVRKALEISAYGSICGIALGTFVMFFLMPVNVIVAVETMTVLLLLFIISAWITENKYADKFKISAKQEREKNLGKYMRENSFYLGVLAIMFAGYLMLVFTYINLNIDISVNKDLIRTCIFFGVTLTVAALVSKIAITRVGAVGIATYLFIVFVLITLSRFVNAASYRDEIIILAEIFVLFVGESLIVMFCNYAEEFIKKGLRKAIMSYGLSMAIVTAVIIKMAGDKASYVVVGIEIAAFCIWYFLRKKIIKIIEKTMEFSANTAFGSIFGKQGIKRFAPELISKFKNGDDMTKEFMIDFFASVNFNGSQELMEKAFKEGSIETQMKVLDLVFSRRIDFKILQNAISFMKPELNEIFLRQYFLYYPALTEENRREDKISASSIAKDKMQENEKFMYEYLFEDNKESYFRLIKKLINSKNNENHSLLCEIMKKYKKEFWRPNFGAFNIILDGLDEQYEVNGEIGGLAVIYDKKYRFLTKYFMGNYKYKEIKSVIEKYSGADLTDIFLSEKGIIGKVYTLCNMTHCDPKMSKHFEKYAEDVLIYIEKLSAEVVKIEKINMSGIELLINEVENLRFSFMAILIDYLNSIESMPAIDGCYEMLTSTAGRRECEDLIRNRIKNIYAERIIRALNKKTKSGSSKYIYSLLIFKESNDELENLYKYFGGEDLEGNISESIERMIILKSIPMFKELDISMLYKILKISKYKRITAEDIVVTEGEMSDSFYIILRGKVAVLKGDKKIAQIETGGMFGELGVIDRTERTASIRTEEDTIFLMIEGNDFIKLLHKNGNIAFSVIKTLSGRLRGMLSK